MYWGHRVSECCVFEAHRGNAWLHERERVCLSLDVCVGVYLCGVPSPHKSALWRAGREYVSHLSPSCRLSILGISLRDMYSVSLCIFVPLSASLSSLSGPALPPKELL